MQQDSLAPITQVLINLQKSDSRFKTWKPWMVPGAKFRTKAGNVYQISEIDEWGNFECVELGLFCISALVPVRFGCLTDGTEIDRHNLP